MRQSAEKVYPHDCAFLLALPTGRDEFLADFCDPSHDFLRSQYKDSALSPHNAWNVYRPVAEALITLLEFLKGKGVHVVPRNTLADWKDVQETCKVVVLFAHWRNGLIRHEEVRWNEVETFGENGSAGTPTGERVRHIIAEASGDRKTIVTRLNQLLLQEPLGDHPWFGAGLNQLPASAEHRLYINRKFLEEAAPGIFGRNSSVEFADGLVCIERIAQVAVPTFRGILDLSVCNSILLGELIKGHAPHCLVVATKIPAVVDFRIVFYRALFEFLAPGRPYLSAIEELRSRILKDLEKRR